MDSFLNAIQEKETLLATNEYGTFVLQKLLSNRTSPSANFSELDLDQIYRWFISNFMSLSTSASPLSVVKKSIAKFLSHQDEIKLIIQKNIEILSQHQYGNYAVQVAIHNYTDLDQIYSLVLNSLQSLSKQKISSNVEETCLDQAEPEWIEKFVSEFLKKDFIKQMIRNQYAFFVLERMIMKATAKEAKHQLKDIIAGNIQSVSDIGLRLKWEKLVSRVCSG